MTNLGQRTVVSRSLKSFSVSQAWQYTTLILVLGRQFRTGLIYRVSFRPARPRLHCLKKKKKKKKFLLLKILSLL